MPAEPVLDTVLPSRGALFLGYLKIGMLGFGGVAAIARHVLVVERRWLTERDYAAVLGVGQLLPGPNVGNAAVMIGRRFHGLAGALLATVGLYALPLVILATLCTLYDRIDHLATTGPLLDGVAAAGGGLVIGTAAKTARRAKLPPSAIAIAGATAATVLSGVPLLPVVLVAVPLSVFLSVRAARAR